MAQAVNMNTTITAAPEVFRLSGKIFMFGKEFSVPTLKKNCFFWLPLEALQHFWRKEPQEELL